MNLLWAVLLLVATCVVSVGVMLAVRRRAPEGSYFSDGDRASGVFGVLATGFSVLLGFIIFLAFTSYDESRSGAETEATTVSQQLETAQFLPADTASELNGELVCYARWVVGPEWDAMADGSLDSSINPWGAAMYRTMKSADPQTATEQSAYDRWMDQTVERQQARVSRIQGAEGIIPLPLWLVLFTISVVIFVYMLFFADRAERARTQALLMGSVSTVICLLLMLVVFFDHPHGHGVGRLHPTAMERTLRLMDAQFEVADVSLEVPCDDRGTPR
ncbi:MAG TPA: hypothetical protein VFV89_00635 [Nocardioides sp.]|uniref:bestrophin-like domain n=1 Tax=Nocardioides sp. TaxID=35761 RepID=UPI002E30FE64|nr:hypothetical protein [Nocardioides sp.]HEX5086284.1 hypothetical protein [Nocardioides sp.]